MDTSNSAWTQVNSELPKDLRHKWPPGTLSFPGGNWDAALPSGNPHGSGMSKYTPGTYWSYLLLPQSAPTCTSDWSLCTSLEDLGCLLSEDTAPVLFYKGLHAETNLWPCSGLDGVATGGLLFGRLNGLLISAWWLAGSCQWQGMATYLVTLSAFAQLLRLV